MAGADDVFVLVPPSEGKAAGGAGRWKAASGRYGRTLGVRRGEVIEALAKALAGADDRTAEKLLGVRGDLLVRALAATDALAAGRARALPAWQRYTGVVWEHLEAATLPAGDDDRRRLLVPSALLGLVAGTDPVPDHRLKFGVSLPGLGRLDRWWRPAITDALRRLPRAATVVDLLPQEHAAAVDLGRLKATVLTATFVDPASGAVGGHGAKAAKGRFARTLLVDGLAGAGEWTWEGWRVDLTPV
jgi:cytoplasmic iron level regulating protein YaaA (DUF328/UPF0246 family)